MGRAVIGGIVTSTMLTLVVVPVLYAYPDSLGTRFIRRFRRSPEEATGQAAAQGTLE